jgi:hypothetical protein
MYPTNCTLSGCSDSEYIDSNDAEWFYEYFAPGDNATFLGSLGPDKSAGTNGKFNTYSFYSLGDTWYFQFNNQTLGSATLGVGNSGPYSPLAMGELANASDASVQMKKVIFTNLSAYKSGFYLPVSEAFGTIGYGVGSSTFLKNPYGVEEIGDRVNYFQVGSGLPQYTNNTKIWSLGYKLRIISEYGNLSSRNSYAAYSSVKVAAPDILSLSNFSRAVFQGWTGVGAGSYSGLSPSVSVVMNANITEMAFWQLQNFMNISSSFGNATGTGWYPSNSTVSYSLNSGVVYRDGKPRFLFSGWSNGNPGLNGTFSAGLPAKLTADWKYTTALFGKDAYGEVLEVPGFLIDKQRTNSTPLLDASADHFLEGAYYKGALILLNYTIRTNSSDILFFNLPVYNVNVTTKDILGFPMNVSANVTYTNGTKTILHSGPKGMIAVPDVPYGYASLSFSQIGLRTLVHTEGGNPETVTFFSSSDMTLSVFAAVMTIYMFIWEYRSRTKRKAPVKPPEQTQKAKA